MDFNAMMAAAHTQIFGAHEQPNLPTRSVFQVSRPANSGGLAEIEVVAAAKDAP